MRRFLIAVVAVLAIIVDANAQKTVSHVLEYESFVNVKVTDDFIVKLVSSDKYMVRTNVDERLDDYVKAYVQNGTLNLIVERKNFPSELKKALRVKGAPAPILEVEISFPSIKSLEMTDNSILHKSDVIHSDEFALTMSDKARVDKIFVECSSAEVVLAKAAYAEVEARASEGLFLITSNTSKAIVKQTGKSIKIDAAGSSNVKATVEVDEIDVLAAGLADLTFLPGNAASMKVSAVGSSKLDAESLNISKADVIEAGTAKCYVNVKDTLKVNLIGNSLLTFKNKPYIDVERIVGSTLIKSDDPKRK